MGKDLGSEIRFGRKSPGKSSILLHYLLGFASFPIIWLLLHRSPSALSRLAPYFKPTNVNPELRNERINWSQIKPSENLEYQPCFEDFECARLIVPMDWKQKTNNSANVTIAIIKLPAPVPVTDPRYSGPILFNPGGPGGSGVRTLSRMGHNYSTIVNPGQSTISQKDGKFFDVVSFDPRGVNNTLPKSYCFPDSASHDIWEYQLEEDGIDRESSASITNRWARAKAIQSRCPDESGITQHMTTPAVVADMVQFIEKHGEWRAKQAEIWLNSKEGKIQTARKPRDHPYSRDAVLERTRWRRGREEMHYWGFSYGTVLGSTFAAMEPDRVERLILDGVCDPNDYYETKWQKNLQDTDALVARFFEYCSTAGSEKCALNTGNSSSAEIQVVVENLVSDLKKQPLAIPRSPINAPDIITYSDVMLRFRYDVYKPLDSFSRLATVLADLVYGHGFEFAKTKQEMHEPSCPLQCNDRKKKGNTPDCWPDNMEVTNTISCSDGKSITHMTERHFKDNLDLMYGQSKWLGEFWASISLACMHWNTTAAWKITGDEIKGDTAHPLFLIGNTLDPVTPLRNAHTTAQRFPGSIVLTQDSIGHCSTSSPSLCTAKHIRTYFQTGALPDNGTVCQPEELPLIGKVGREEEGGRLALDGDGDGDDEVLLAAWRGVVEGTERGGVLGY